jgi:hypothetical protein
MYLKTLKTLISLVVLLFIIYALFRAALIFTKPITKISLSQSSVVKQVQALNKLETASYTIEKIIEGGVDGNLFQDILFGDKILLIAHGNVVAGFDLAKLTDTDISITENLLSITLPAPEILYSKLDNTQTKVYDRKLGLLSKGDKGLESEARLSAEMSIRKAACDGGIFKQAEDNVRQQFIVMFSGFGFPRVEVKVKGGVCG